MRKATRKITLLLLGPSLTLLGCEDRNSSATSRPAGSSSSSHWWHFGGFSSRSSTGGGSSVSASGSHFGGFGSHGAAHS